jgi:hypothetical protein
VQQRATALLMVRQSSRGADATASGVKQQRAPSPRVSSQSARQSTMLAIASTAATSPRARAQWRRSGGADDASVRLAEDSTDRAAVFADAADTR